jgi:hypothetical protein
MAEEQPDEGRRSNFIENESFDVAIGVRDHNGKFIPLSIGPNSSTISLAAVLKLLDPSGDEVQARSDEQRILRNRPYEPFRTQAVVALGGAWATVFTCPANSIAKCTVSFGQTAAGTTDFEVALRVKACTVSVGLGFDIFIDAPSPILGPYTLAAGDIIEAYRAGGANGAVLIDYELWSVGDTNTGV